MNRSKTSNIVDYTNNYIKTSNYRINRPKTPTKNIYNDIYNFKKEKINYEVPLNKEKTKYNFNKNVNNHYKYHDNQIFKTNNLKKK